MAYTKITTLREQRTIIEELQNSPTLDVAVLRFERWLKHYNYDTDMHVEDLVAQLQTMRLFQGIKRLRFWLYEMGLEDSTDCQHIMVYRATGQCTSCGLSKENIASDEVLQELRRKLRTSEEQAHEDSVSGRVRLFRNGGSAQTWEERIVELRDDLRELRQECTE